MSLIFQKKRKMFILMLVMMLSLAVPFTAHAYSVVSATLMTGISGTAGALAGYASGITEADTTATYIQTGISVYYNGEYVGITSNYGINRRVCIVDYSTSNWGRYDFYGDHYARWGDSISDNKYTYKSVTW